MPITDKTYYVYGHYEDYPSGLVYVGIGTSCRAFRATGSGHRSHRHKQWLENKYTNGSIPVHFFAHNLSRPAAIALEKQLIRELRPCFNKIGNPDYKHDTKYPEEVIEFAKKLHLMGYGYRNIAKLLGFPVPKNQVMTVKRMVLRA